MTGSVRIVDRMRWMVAVGAAATLALVACLAMLASRADLSTLAGPPSAQSPISLSTPAGSSAPLDPRIAAIARRHPTQLVQALVQFNGGVSVERARWDVSRFSGQVFGQLHIINALAVKLPARRARRLAADADVHAVSLNAVVKTEGGPAGPPPTAGPAGAGPQANGSGPRADRAGGHPGARRPGGPGGAPGISTRHLQSTYDQTMGVTGLWGQGIDGASVGVAVIDTGVAGDLPDFQSSGGQGSRVVETAVTNPDATNATDDYGHGTTVAGIIAGNGDNLDRANPLHGNYIGIAPEANLISIKVSDDQGKATVLDVIYGLQFAVDHQKDYNLRVVNMSLDSTTPQSYTTDPLDAAVESAWMHGITVVVAAGNRGSASDAVQYAPANDPYAITVGAVNEHGQSNPANDTIAAWSSQGTTQDGFQKPDVYAPGAHIVSVLAPGSLFQTLCASCTIGGQYIRTSGTSMATPMISGLVADLLQAHPDWTPDQVKGALTDPDISSNPAIQEPDGAKVVALSAPPSANAGLTPNGLISDSNGDIDYTRSSWSRSSWSTATGALDADFARSSWSCTCSDTGAGADSSGDADSSRSSWSRSSWSTYFDPSDG